jgi:hypothetical protein
LKNDEIEYLLEKDPFRIIFLRKGRFIKRSAPRGRQAAPKAQRSFSIGLMAPILLLNKSTLSLIKLN